MIYVDTREKRWAHVEEFFLKHNIEYTKKKLDTGDYMTDGNQWLSIDRKHNLDEVAANLCTVDSKRFWNEVRRAKADNIKLILLIEARGYKSIHDVAEKWSAKYSQITGQYLAREMYRLEIGYNISFVFCDPRSTGRIIAELLGEK